MTDMADQKVQEYGFETLALHTGPEVDPSTGLAPGYVRLSVGLESIYDIPGDLEGALSGA